MQQVILKYAGDSDRGLVRESNEDRYHCDPDRGIFIVIDGVGGEAAGEKAAETALSRLKARLERQTDNVEVRIREAIALANNQIYELAQSNDEWKGMSCVLTVAVIEDSKVTIGQVGDTRLYKLHNGQLSKITHDHSPVGELEDVGKISEAEAMLHPRRSEVFRDVGSKTHTPDDEDFVETIQVSFEPDCALLLCSDGLSDYVTSEQIAQIIEQYAGDPEKAVNQLISKANEAGGLDNITALCIEGEEFANTIRARGVEAKVPPIRPEKQSELQTSSSKETSTQAVNEKSVISGSEPLSVTIAHERKWRLWRQHMRRTFLRTRRILGNRWAILFFGILLGIISLIGLNILKSRIVGPVSTSPTTRATAERKSIHTVGHDERADFLTISDALEASHAGDTIIVEPGEYGEQIQLKEGVNLISQKPREAVIRISNQMVNASSAVLAFKLRTGRFVGFKITGGEQGTLTIGLRLSDSDIEVEDVEVSGARTGVEIEGTSAATLRANYIHDNSGSGVVIRGGGAPRLAHNIIVRNGKRAENGMPGIEIADRSQPILAGNVIADNGAEGIFGRLTESPESIIQKNFFGDDGKPNAKGKIRVLGSGN